MPNRYSQYSLPNSQMNWVTPEIVQFTPQLADTNLLVQSFARNEERQRLANERAAQLDTMFADMRSKLHEDKETMDWFNDFENKYSQELNDYINIGDYGAAINAGSRLGAKAAKDAGLQARIKANSEYENIIKEQQQRVGKDVDQSTWKWWLSQNPYEYEDMLDENGNVVGGNLVKPNPLYSSIDMSRITKYTRDLITARKGSKQEEISRQYQNNTGGQYMFSDGKEISPYYSEHNTDGSYSLVWEKLDPKYIQENIDEWIYGTGGVDNYNAVIQAFNVAKWDYEKLEKEIENLNNTENKTLDITQQIIDKQYQLSKKKDLLYANGSPVADFKTWYANVVIDNAIKNNMAYDWTFRTDVDKKAYSISEPSAQNPRNPNTSSSQNSNYPSYEEPSAPTVDDTSKETQIAQENISRVNKEVPTLFSDWNYDIPSFYDYAAARKYPDTNIEKLNKSYIFPIIRQQYIKVKPSNNNKQ